MKLFVAILLLLALSAKADASDARGQAEAKLERLGLARNSLALGRHLLVDTQGSDPIGADTLGNGKGAKATAESVAAAPSAYTAKAPTSSYAAKAPTTTYAAKAPTSAYAVKAPTTAVPLTSALTFPAATAYGAGAAPVSAPFGQSAPSVTGRRLLVDTRGSDPVGSDTKGSGAVGVNGNSQYAKAVFKAAPIAAPLAAPVAAGGPVPLSTILYSSVPMVGKYSLAAAPTTAPGALAAPSLAGRKLLA